MAYPSTHKLTVVHLSAHSPSIGASPVAAYLRVPFRCSIEKLTAVAHAGFDGVEIFDQDLLCSLWTPRRIRERCDELGLKIEMLQPFRDLFPAGSGD